MNGGKEASVVRLLDAWRCVAQLYGKEQWRVFFESGRFNNRLRTRQGYDLVGTARGQMIEAQVVGILDSFLSNRSNDFRELVNASDLDAGLKHQLHFINRWKGWFVIKDKLTMRSGDVISEDTRRLARSIMRHVLSKHRKPDLSHIGMLIDQRSIKLESSKKSSRHGWWLRMATLAKGKPISIPLAHTARMEARAGVRALTLQVNQDRITGAIHFGVLTNCTQAFQESRQDYRPRTETIALDVGLCTLLATSDGGLLGQRWKERLEWHDRRITRLTAQLQRQGLKPNSSVRYRTYVQALRGWVASEVGRTLNRLVHTHAPAEIVTELLDFRAPALSRRLNRLIGKFGKGCLEAKLKDLEERFGIALVKVNPAYTSQLCNSCGYVDKRNRKEQSTFSCLFCGSKRHADGNAACNLRDRRSAPAEDCKRHRKGILTDLVEGFNKAHPRPRVRSTGAKARAADPRLSNPHFRGWALEVGQSGDSVSTRHSDSRMIL